MDGLDFKRDETMRAVLGDTASEQGSQILEWLRREESWSNLPLLERKFYNGEWFEVWLAGTNPTDFSASRRLYLRRGKTKPPGCNEPYFL
ncbi:MAG: hypothetical protein IPK21_13755 [Haliscomenobacter sp.]|nr:hypothetical protein [Haliscomenobacter sp.]